MEQQKSVLSQRRKPSQERSKATCEAILQAAAHILEDKGETAFTSNRIAERAGVSIGSLYQYFPNKDAILFALAAEEESRLPCLAVLRWKAGQKHKRRVHYVWAFAPISTCWRIIQKPVRPP